MNRTLGTLTLSAALTFLPSAKADLWLGNDTLGSVFRTTNTGGVVTTLPGLPTTGIASDGTNLYFADPAGNFTKRTSNGATVLDSFVVGSGDTGEDLAWDSKRNVLWRIVHTNVLQEINPATHSLLNSFAIPTSDPILGTLGGLGIAYDSSRDELYVSFCAVGCSSLAAGLIDIVNPVTGGVLGSLFRTSGFATGGLGYDAATDTLWVGDNSVVRNMSRSGTVLSNFARPSPGGFVDGLEFVPTAVPEPASGVLLATGVLVIAGILRRRISSQL